MADVSIVLARGPTCAHILTMNQREMFGWSLSLTPGAVAQPRRQRKAAASLDLFAAPASATEVQTEAPVAVDRSAAARTVPMFEGS